ncbi:MAG TPA: DNA helicase RecQ [Vicinamibacterales bacterium]|nr:DNA helicase RecQ [Vicinamibacterales bacterium]
MLFHSVTTLDQVLSKYWGYTSFRPLQREAMDAILDARDSVVVLPTGGGKSLCFQAPALVSGGVALVVSPLISLMKDQVDTLVENGIAAACYNSAMAADEKASVAAGIREGRYALVYVSPERLAGEGGESFLQMVGRIGYLAVDEAHCISQWGHDFRPEYRQLGALRARFPRVSLHAFTATATGRVRRDIATQLELRDPIELVGSFDRPNLVYRVLPRSSLKTQLHGILARHRGNAGIIYCTSRREVDALAEWLSSTGLRALPYHAGLADAERHRNQDRFINEEADVIVATVAFGMGIDRSDVRFVVHAGAPQSLEHYQQESGRAGRDGLEAECVLVYSGADFLKWRVMLERNGELTDARRSLLRDIERYAAGVGCRHRHLVSYFGERYDKEDCGACDYCLGELEAVDDAVVIARKILSCVARVGQRFGAAHVANVLCGSESEQVTKRRHQQLSTFGLLRDAAVPEVRGYIEQISAEGLLRQTDEPYPVLALTEAGVALLKDAGACPDLTLARQRRVTKDRRPSRPRPDTEGWKDVDHDLFDRLRTVRLRLARERGVPPYVIFHDTTLRELARLRPSSVDELSGVYGIGARKAQQLGAAFVDEIRAYLATDQHEST